MKLKVFLSESFNPHLNLATEEWIFHNLDPSSQVMFLWRNEETVVIGRNQNPWSECNLSQMKEDKVHLARRTTGGGAVFHDLGNTNFTFLSPKEAYKRENNIQIILEALKGFKILGEASGRNDLVIPSHEGPKKFSGSAYREKKDRAFHHGTLLLHADLSRLARYLTPNPKKLKSKGRESVRARVLNLNEMCDNIDHGKIVENMVQSFEKFYSSKAQIEMLDLSSLKKSQELNNQYENLSSFEWLYGRTMEFTQEMDDYLSLGFFHFKFLVEDALVKDIEIFTDCLYPQVIEDLKNSLKERSYTGESVRKAFLDIEKNNPTIRSDLIELRDWLVKKIEI